MVGAALDDDVAGLEPYFLRIEHQHDLAVQHEAEFEGARFLHVAVRRLRRVGGRAGRAHRLEIRLDFPRARRTLSVVVRPDSLLDAVPIAGTMPPWNAFSRR